MCRRHFPDVLLGVYTMDELQDAPQEPRPTTGRVVTENPMARIETVETFADLPETQPDPQPQQSLEPVMKSPLDVSEATERNQLLGEIRDWMLEVDIKTAKFAPLCRAAGLLASGVQIVDDALPIEDLRKIHDNRMAILEGTYKPI
jgi:hypothetical protein